MTGAPAEFLIRPARDSDLDAITGHLERHDIIDSATWTVSTES